MRRIFVYINIVISLFLLFGVSACVHETDISVPSGQEEIPEDKVRIEIFTRAKSYNLPATRAVGNEYAVGMHPWVFVFRGEGTDAVFVEAVQAFEYLAKTEGIICAIESAHAVAGAIKYAKNMGKNEIILITLSGRGDKDVAAIARYRGQDLKE